VVWPSMVLDPSILSPAGWYMRKTAVDGGMSYEHIATREVHAFSVADAFRWEAEERAKAVARKLGIEMYG
jgi:hypothetical protein